MGGKGSGRPRGSYKPLSEVFAGMQKDVGEIEGLVYRKCNALRLRMEYHIWKQKKLEDARRKIKESGK